jgi:hypothetical protein
MHFRNSSSAAKTMAKHLYNVGVSEIEVLFFNYDFEE